MRRVPALVLVGTLAVGLLACGDDGGSDLTAAEREWCTLDDSDAGALRFDDIFEVGLELRLGMDAVNAYAAGQRAQYEAEGMSSADAVAKVSEELFEIEAYVLACKEAYRLYEGEPGS